MEIDSKENISPSRLAWLRFKQNRMAVAGLYILAMATLIAILGGAIRPDSTKNANSQQVSLAKKGINFSVKTLQVRKNAEVANEGFLKQFFFGGKENPHRIIPIHSYSFSGDSISGYIYGGTDQARGEPFAFNLLDVVEPIDIATLNQRGEEIFANSVSGERISATRSHLESEILTNNLSTTRYLFGTDKFGRDMLSRLMAGTIVSLSVGLISVLISLLLGISLGAIAGYFGGWIDDFITWIINVVWSIPTLLLVIAITFALGKGFVQVFIAVGLTMWVEVARVVRGQVLSLKNMEYIEASRALGYSTFRIISRHIIPNIMGPVIVISAANFASAILLEAGLSFLGIGAQIPMASWGQMIKDHYAYITTDMAYLAILPGLCISLLVLAFMLIGNGLRDSLDTRFTA
ncbi:ABC transporter permease [Cryomorpha ignava]|uniref:ABC transporter permease n=1 Tax=Cryomorpha ignava TaxID=101383 RepID=A0A7K3WR36_9FLAO|nr:ABC transporter permease [Cryomorpha ignava]NEN23986.1 ABC transporter permease [Cryomorpha ignava]